MRRPLAILLALVYTVVLFFAFSWSRCFFDGCPNVESLAVYQPGGAPVLLDRHGEAFADLAPAEREAVPLSSLPSHVAQAFLAVEDQRFYAHGGIDWHRVGGAVLANFRAGQFAQGFSTITMQLARNVFPERIPGQEQTTRRKLIEIRVAQEIERKYSKEEILELYLNNIYFGNRARGIEAASRQYFGHSARELTLPEAATLAAIPKAPSHYDPRRHPEASLERRNLVIALMKEQGRIPRFIAEDARRSALRVVPAPRQEQVESGLAPYFVEQVRRELEERFGPELYSQPLRIVTTLDSAAQRAVEEELRAQLKRVENGRLGGFNGPGYSLLAEPPADGTPYLQGAAVMLEARTGDVLAWVGGRDYAQSQFDRVVQARRQPGSAFKPFVYAAALTNGWALSQPLLDQPLRVRLPGGQFWQPHNFTDRYEGRVTMRDALVRSKNVPTVRLADAVGISEVTDLARQAGIDEDIAPVPSVALGSAAVSPLELTAAYTAFATLGMAAEPRLILRLENEEGKVLWRSEPRRHKVLDPCVAFLVTDVLSEALKRGTGNLVQETGLKVPAAGKTGTTNDGADTWFVGYTPEIVAGIWIGFDKPRPILENATGGRLAAPVWGRALARVYQKRPQPKPWPTPERVVSLPVDPQTGLVIEAGCDAGNSARELFIEGMVPASYCPGREAPPSNGFPAQRLMAERKEEQKEEKTERLAQAREEEKRVREQQRTEQAERTAREPDKTDDEEEQTRVAERRQEEKKKAEEKERARLAERREKIARAEAAADRREKEIAAREKKEKKEKKTKAEQTRLAEQKTREKEENKKDEEKERARLEERREKIARAEAAAARREKEIAAREEATRKEKSTEKEKEKKDDDRVEKALEEERRARAREDEEDEARADRDKEDREEDRVEEASSVADDLSGWWEMTNTIQSTNYADYKGLRLGYRIQLEQDGDRIVGRGQKWSENGRTLPASARTPLTVNGTIDGNKVILEFRERGAKRTTTGRFSWTLSADRTALRGSFQSTAADASGRSLAVRMP
ncbi:MAG TPA: PBP1A family penicillin-binding protein [Thermoanaerobaculia bacterium]|jgi:penicillin-binding protein 1A|nr:PBP1A family penicillin-binding protein [Thermoanaerobaculia bacterium]